MAVIQWIRDHKRSSILRVAFVLAAGLFLVPLPAKRLNESKEKQQYRLAVNECMRAKAVDRPKRTRAAKMWMRTMTQDPNLPVAARIILLTAGEVGGFILPNVIERMDLDTCRRKILSPRGVPQGQEYCP